MKTSPGARVTHRVYIERFGGGGGGGGGGEDPSHSLLFTKNVLIGM